MKLATITEIGSRRSNQDSLLVVSAFNNGGIADIQPVADYDPMSLDNMLILAVADGMGGLEHGEIASAAVVRAIIEYLETNPTWDKVNIEQVVQKVSFFLHQMYGQSAGTTLSMLVLLGGEFVLYHAGDSRVYHKKSDSSELQITNDHSAVKKLMDEGVTDQNRLRAAKNKITNAIGLFSNARLDVEIGSYSEGDSFLLCSDGFWHFNDSVLGVFNWSTSQGLTWAVENARTHGETDNATAIGITILGS